MLYSKPNLEVVDVAHRGKHRHALGGVYLAHDGSTVATDGRRLMRVSHYTPREQRQRYGADDTIEVVTGGPDAVLPWHAAVEVRRAIKGKWGTATVEPANGDPAQLRCRAGHAARPYDAQHPAIDGHFPAINAVIPTGEAEYTMYVNARTMGELLKAVSKAIGDDGTEGGRNAVTLSFYGPNNAFRIEGTNGETDQEVLAIMMPCSQD